MALRTVLALVAVVALTSALKTNLKIRSDSRALFKIEEFGFTKGGVFYLKASNIKYPNDGNTTQRSFVIDVSDTIGSTLVSSSNVCSLLAAASTSILTVPLSSAKNNTLVFQRDVTSEVGYFHLFFANCAGGSVSFDLYLEQYNTVGKSKNYLSAGNERLIPMLSTLSAVYGVAFVGWCIALWKRRSTANRAHIVMAVFVVVKMFSLVFESIQLAYQMAHGERGGWAVPYFGFLAAKGTMVLILIVLLGSGWSFLKPFLSKRDKTIIMIVIPLQIVDNIALIFVEAAPPGAADWTSWHDVLRIFDVVCCAAVIIPIVWSIRHLRDASRTDGKAAISLQRLQVFREFYLIVVAYLYFQVILLYLLNLALPYNAAWVSPLCEEMVSMMFYAFVGWKFRPMPEQPQLVVEFEETLAPGSVNSVPDSVAIIPNNDGSEDSHVVPSGHENRRHTQEISLLKKEAQQ